MKQLSDYKLNPDNPRQISKDKFEKLCKSIKEFPIMLKYRPIVVDDTGIILGGNMRYRALLQNGTKEVPDEYVVNASELTDEQKREFIIKDNVEFGDYDWDKIANEWDAGQLEDWGMELQGFKEEEVEEDEAPEVSQEEPKSKLGEIYQMGKHRVMCGDSTKIEDVEKLMGEDKADMLFTDPPYGMNAVSKSGVLSERYGSDIIGDDDNTVAVDAFKLCQSLMIEKQIWWGANYYSSILPDSECWLVWDKNNGGSDQTDCELAWTNMRSVVRMFSQSSEKTNRVHPTQKPVSLVAWVLKKFDVGNILLDVFLGSGSTLIACEQTNRICYGMEIDPKYVDVIRKRYAKFIGKEEEWETITPKI